MWVLTTVIPLFYYIYAFMKTFGIPGEVVTFTSFIGSLEMPTLLIAFLAAPIIWSGHHVFGGAQKEYQNYYIQYLIADFLVLQGVDHPETIVTAESLTGNS
jgi:hypothetical protein